MTESQHLRTKLKEQQQRINELENAQQKAVNDLIVYKRMLKAYQTDGIEIQQLQEQIILQMDTVKLSLERSVL